MSSLDFVEDRDVRERDREYKENWAAARSLARRESWDSCAFYFWGSVASSLIRVEHAVRENWRDAVGPGERVPAMKLNSSEAVRLLRGVVTRAQDGHLASEIQTVLSVTTVTEAERVTDLRRDLQDVLFGGQRSDRERVSAVETHLLEHQHWARDRQEKTHRDVGVQCSSPCAELEHDAQLAQAGFSADILNASFASIAEDEILPASALTPTVFGGQAPQPQ